MPKSPRFVIDAMNRKNIDLALAVQEQVGAEFASADAQRACRIEAMRYEAELARRRFFEVDPANRLVAAALEAEWNDRLRALEEACREREARAATRESELSGRQRERIGELARDFEQVWNAPGTGNADRKRLLGLLIEGCDADPGRLRGRHRPAHARRQVPDARRPTAKTDGADPQDTSRNHCRTRPPAGNAHR